MNKILLFITPFLFGNYILNAQNIVIYNKSNLTPIESAELLIDGVGSQKLSNAQGIIKIELPDDAKTFGFFALGYESVTFNADALDTLSKVYLKPLAYNLREVAIVENRKSVPIRSEIGVVQLDAQYISKLPTVFAEPDLLKALQLLPGVSSVMENNVGLYVRGGKAEHSLITIDGATVYNPAHSVGFFSVVHPASVSSASLYKEAFPGNFGSRSSAFLDVQLKEGNYNKFQGALSIGLISSYLDLQGPISKGKRPTSFQFVGRTTYIDRMVKAFSYEEPQFNTGFSDYSFKISSKLSEHKKLTMAYYHSHDHYKFLNVPLINFGSTSSWDNNVASIKLSNSKSNKWLKTTSATYTQYQLENNFTGAIHTSGLQDYGLNYDLKAFDQKQLVTQAGVQSTLHLVSPGQMSIVDSAFFNYEPFDLGTQTFLEVAPYVNFKKELKNNYVAKANFRLSSYVTNNFTSIQPEPRLQIAKKYGYSTLALSYDRLSQFMQLYSANVTPMPTDAWFVSSKNIRPVVSNSISLSYNQSGYERDYSLNTSLYYRHFSNVTDIRAGGSAIIEPDYEKWLRAGNNNSFGFEFLLQKQKGTLTGWVSYTYSRSINNIKGILDNGSVYNANHDKPHILNITANKRIKKWELNGVFVLQSGRPITLPLYTVGIISLYSERNEYRLPLYHRMDISFIHYQKKRKHFQGSWMISIYNVYSRRNVYNVQFNPVKGRVDYLNLFPILPFASYKVEIF